MKNSIEKITQSNQVNKNTLDNIEKIAIKFNSDNFLKQIVEIPILINHTLSS
jgi:hypothetical protein